MLSVISVSSGEAICGLLDLVKAPSPIVDVTYGSGVFWKDQGRHIIGGDLNPARARDFSASFLQLPFADRSVPTLVFDPPFHPNVGSAEEDRFSSLGDNDFELRALFGLGVRECWRCTKSFLIVKCQGFVHNHKPQWMPLWAIEECGEPYEWLIVWRTGKRSSGRWTSNNSLRRNHADYLVFSRKGNHR